MENDILREFDVKEKEGQLCKNQPRLRLYLIPLCLLPYQLFSLLYRLLLNDKLGNFFLSATRYMLSFPSTQPWANGSKRLI